MPFDWKLLIVLTVVVFVATGAGIVLLINWAIGRWGASLLPDHMPEPTAEEVAHARIERLCHEGHVLLPEDLLAEVTRIQQDPAALVPLPRLESERGGIPTGQLYPLTTADRADIALDAEHKRRTDGAGEI